MNTMSSQARNVVTGTVRMESGPHSWESLGLDRWNLVLSTEGSCRIENEFGICEVAKGDVVLCEPSARRTFSVGGLWETIWFQLDVTIPVSWDQPIPRLHRIHPSEEQFARFRADAEEAYHLIFDPDGDWMPLVANLLETMVLRGNYVSRHNRMDPVLVRCADYLSERSSAPVMDAVARRFGMSRSKFFTQFRKACGMTPFEYHETVRFRKVTHLLVSTDLNFSEIADRCGFSSLCYLSRRFRKRFGMTMREYRSRLR